MGARKLKNFAVDHKNSGGQMTITLYRCFGER